MRIILLVTAMLFFANSSTAQNNFDVYFDFNKDVPSAASAVLFKRWITENPKVVVTALFGYADSTDANSYNKTLSRRRIQSVRKLLEASKIVISERAVEKPFGEDFRQLDDPAKNRKVRILYQNQPDENREVAAMDSIAEDIAPLFKNRKPGDLVRIQNIHFFRNKEEVIPHSQPIIEQLYTVMMQNPKLSIEIHGHICCNPNVNDTRLSYRRAKYIFTYLLKKGIPLNRLAYKGFGSSRPIYPIPEQTRAEQIANRRVEILIIRN